MYCIGEYLEKERQLLVSHIIIYFFQYLNIQNISSDQMKI